MFGIVKKTEQSLHAGMTIFVSLLAEKRCMTSSHQRNRQQITTRSCLRQGWGENTSLLTPLPLWRGKDVVILSVSEESQRSFTFVQDDARVEVFGYKKTPPKRGLKNHTLINLLVGMLQIKCVINASFCPISRNFRNEQRNSFCHTF